MYSSNLPNSESILKLFYSKLYDEAKIVALHGINLIVNMYSGRGGCLNPKKMLHSTVKHLSAYLDTLYWIAIKDNDISSANIILGYLKLTNRYDEKGFDDISSHVTKQLSLLESKVYKIYISCYWTQTSELYKNWKNLFETLTQGKSSESLPRQSSESLPKQRFENICIDGDNSKSYLGYCDEKLTYILTDSINDADYFVMAWGSQIKLTDEQLKRTIFLRTEPSFPDKIKNGSEEIKGEPLKFLRYFDYTDLRYPNCAEYWLPNKPSELLNINFEEKLNCISAVVSARYVDEGHKLRVDLLKYIVEKYPDFANDNVHIYGYSNAHNFPNIMYKGSLPNNDKSKGLYGYKYTLAAENNAIKGYFTEKIIDGILSECLVFYWGCPNITDYFPEIDGKLPYVLLPMENQEESYGTISDSSTSKSINFELCSKLIMSSINNNLWEDRIYAIKETKKSILSKFMLRHRISLVLHEEFFSKTLGDDGINILNLSKALTHKNLVNGKRLFSSILYNGSRYDKIKEMLDFEHSTKFVKFESLCDKIPENIPFVQEFSNPIPKTPHDEISQYTIGFSRFSIKNFAYPDAPKTFVINLERRKDRLGGFMSRFPRCHDSRLIKIERKSENSFSDPNSSEFETCEEWFRWEPTVFNAVDGKKMAEAGFSEGIKYLFRDNDFNMKPAVVGCALSHIKLWKQLVADKDTDHYLIFEDDVEFTDSYAWKLFSLMQNITFSWDVLYLGHLVCYEEMQNHRLEGELPKWEMMSKYIVPKRTSWVGTASYMISKSGAEKLLNDIDDVGVNHGIDYFMQLRFNKLLRAYGCRPMLNFAEYASPLNPNIDVDTDIQK